MAFETPFGLAWSGDITASVHEHGVPPGAPPSTIIRTDQRWSVHVRWHTDGVLVNPLIHGFWHLHCFLESLGPGADLDLIDPGDHVIPLTPAAVPTINYSAHFDVGAGRVNIPDPVPPAGRLYRLVVSLTYRELGPGGTVGPPGPIAAFVEGPVLQFYQP